MNRTIASDATNNYICIWSSNKIDNTTISEILTLIFV